MPFVMLKPDQRARRKPCRRCGYSLRNNIDARNCPECGLAVRISLRDDDALEWSNPAWLRRSARATALIAVAHAGLLAALGVAQVAAALPVRWEDLWSGSGRIALVFRLAHGAQVAVAACMLLAAAGAAWLAAYEGRHPDDLRFGRLVLRVGATCLAGMALWELVRAAGWVRYLFIPSWVHVLAASLAAFPACWYLHHLMRRVPSRRVMDGIWLVAVILILANLFIAVSPARDWVAFAMIRSPWRRYAWPWTVAALVYVPLATVLTTLCWLRLRSAAREADKNWETDP